MTRHTQRAFLALIIVQTLHSIEEYNTALYATLAPARFVSGLISDDPALGFAVLNFCIVAFGYWCYFFPVRAATHNGRRLAWGWAGVECANGVAHIAFAVSAGGYFSGVLTAPLLIAVSVVLMKSLRKDQAP
jgi:hypothetical protein